MTLRQSSIKEWLRCPASYYAKYVLGLELDRDSIHLEFGTHYHKQVENYHNGELYSHDLVSGYISEFAPTGEVEVPFRFVPEWDGVKLACEVTGTIDRVNPGEAMFDVKTSKGSWSQAKADAPMGIGSGTWADYSGIQATLYLWYWWQVHGELLPFTFIVYRKDWTPKSRFSQIQTVTTTRTPEDFKRLWVLCGELIEAISNETVWPCQCADQAHSIWSNV